MWTATLVFVLMTLTYSIWIHLRVRRQSCEKLDRLRKEEDKLRSMFTADQLAYFDRHFEQRGIARK